jgi:hypothetical protein
MGPPPHKSSLHNTTQRNTKQHKKHTRACTHPPTHPPTHAHTHAHTHTHTHTRTAATGASALEQQTPTLPHLLCVHQCALDCCANLTASLAAHTHAALAVTNNSNAAEAHQLATLDDLQADTTNKTTAATRDCRVSASINHSTQGTPCVYSQLCEQLPAGETQGRQSSRLIMIMLPGSPWKG